jgi:ATP/maltotriose-dependent transcriptional regulator MalT
VAALAGDDAFELAESVWWMGEFREALALYEEAHHVYVQEEKAGAAAMCGLALAGLAFMRGDEAIGSGWMGRTLRLLEDLPESAVHGYVLFMEVSGSLYGGDFATAVAQARRLQEMGRTYGDPNLVALGILSEGKALLKQGLLAGAMRLLDEAMLAAVSDKLGPDWAGHIYCQVIVSCYELGDLARAWEWTQATMRWCESMPGAGPFMGVCRVHRAQLFQAQGSWEQAEAEAARVCEELAGFDLGTVAEGYYVVGEIRRLRGDVKGAEEAFRQAHGFGRDPQPGLALLWLGQGQVQESFVSIETAMSVSPQDLLRRARLCGAHVEVALAAGRVDVARRAAGELSSAADTFKSSMLAAAAGQAQGAVLLAEGDVEGALTALRMACLEWQKLNVPYEVARVRLMLSSTYEALGDRSSADLETDAAEQVFRSLGATSELRALEERRRSGARGERPTHGLTERELEILALVSAGQTNRGIAEALTISEKTVARHLTNIYGKIGVSSRTEAARYAFEQGLSGDVRRTS